MPALSSQRTRAPQERMGRIGRPPGENGGQPCQHRHQRGMGDPQGRMEGMGDPKRRMGHKETPGGRMGDPQGDWGMKGPQKEKGEGGGPPGGEWGQPRQQCHGEQGGSAAAPSPPRRAPLVSWALTLDPHVQGCDSATQPWGREAGPPQPQRPRSPDVRAVSRTPWDLACRSGRESATGAPALPPRWGCALQRPPAPVGRRPPRCSGRRRQGPPPRPYDTATIGAALARAPPARASAGRERERGAGEGGPMDGCPSQSLTAQRRPRP